MKPIIPWMGGKRRLAKQILPLFDNHHTYVEAFAGGAALFFMKEPSKVEVINDINGELANLYRVVKHHLEELLRHFKWALMSREYYEWHKAEQPETLTDVQRAARYYYLIKMGFGGKAASHHFGTSAMSPPKLNLMRIEEDFSQAHLRLARAYIESLAWDKCVERYDRPGTLHYLDPPYWGTAGYGNEFGLEEYEKMAVLARTVKGQMIISVGDCPEMRKIFKGLTMKTLAISYTVGGGRKKATELLIQNRAT